MMNHTLFIISFFGFVSALAVHISAIVEAGPAGCHWIWAIHAGVFVVFVPLVFILNRSRNRKTNSPAAFFSTAPWPALAFGFLLFVYAGVNF